MIVYRKLDHEDYQDIVDISKDIWDGTDYLPQLFHQWVDDKGLFLGAVDTYSNKVVGVDKYSVLYDGTGWLEGLRVHKDYRGLGIAKQLAFKAMDQAKADLNSGKIKKIAFSTHVSSVESINLMKSMGFRLEQEYILVLKEYECLDSSLKEQDFSVNKLDMSYAEFKNLPYFEKRANILPFVFYFQEITEELFGQLREEGCFVSINGCKGMFKFKGEPHFICFDESIDAINTFANYYMLMLKGKSTTPPLTSVRHEDTELIEALKKAGYTTWNDWKCDYFYFVY
ncbi:MAG: GNAT family N-acetyltransferase [Caulobacteraceae bacterium]